MRSVFLEVDAEDDASILARFPDAEIHHGLLNGNDLIDACKDAEIVCCFIYSQFTREIIGKLSNLKLICTRSVGVNHIDLAACEERGIVVCHVPDYGSHVVAEHAFALLLSALRQIGTANVKVRKGQFDYHGLKGMSLFGKTIGIVGTGKIGSRTAKIAHGFGMKILATDVCRNEQLESMYGVRYTDLKTLLSQSDIISLHIPADEKTIHIIDAAALQSMKDGVVLINTARGELIDSVALLQALQSGKVKYALLDVLEHEKEFVPNKDLISHERVIVTPHIAFYADDSVKRMYDDAFTSIDEWQAGMTPHHVMKFEKIVCDLPAVSKI